MYIHRNADLSLHKLKCKIDILHPTLKHLSGKYQLEIFGFLSAIRNPVYGQRFLEGLSSRALGLFLADFAHTVYNNVTDPGTHGLNVLSVTSHLIINSLLNRFINEVFLRLDHYAVPPRV